jgi:release factor glutamine methyltransferase
VDAELLLAHVLGVPRGQLLTLDDVTGDDAARFGALVEQRADRVPLQHLTWRAPFRFLELAVGPGVFVPRP